MAGLPCWCNFGVRNDAPVDGGRNVLVAFTGSVASIKAKELLDALVAHERVKEVYVSEQCGALFRLHRPPGSRYHDGTRAALL